MGRRCGSDSKVSPVGTPARVWSSCSSFWLWLRESPNPVGLRHCGLPGALSGVVPTNCASRAKGKPAGGQESGCPCSLMAGAQPLPSHPFLLLLLLLVGS